MDKLSEKLAETIEDSNLEDLNRDLEDSLLETAENAIDDATREVIPEIIQEIPIVKYLIIVPKALRGFSSYLLSKKIIRFLTQIGSVSKKERADFLDRLNNQEKNEIIENLMLVLEKFDNYEKAEIQGKLFAAFIRGTINKQEYESLTYATSMINTKNLERLINFYNNVQPGASPQMNTELLYNFSFLQLITVDNSSIGTWGGGGIGFNQNSLGRKFVNIISS